MCNCNADFILKMVVYWCFLLLLSSVLVSAQPCNSAEVISSLPYTTIDATDSSAFAFPCRGGPPDCYADWYAFTPTYTVTVTVSTCNGASFDTFLRIASGSCANLVCGVSNNDACIGYLSSITTTLTANVQYYIIVTSAYSNNGGTYTLSVTGIPTNDQCPATVITSLPYSIAIVHLLQLKITPAPVDLWFLVVLMFGL